MDDVIIFLSNQNFQMEEAIGRGLMLFRTVKSSAFNFDKQKKVEKKNCRSFNKVILNVYFYST